MAIREIYQYINASRSTLTKEEILAELRRRQYPEDEIEAAFLMDHFNDTRPFHDRKTGDLQKSSIPTLGELTVYRKKEKIGIYVPPTGRRKGQFLVGSLIPLFLYMIGLVLFSSQRSPFPPVMVTQLVITGISVVLGLVAFLALRKTGIDFARGIPVGMIAMITASLLFILVQQLTFFADVFAF